MRTIQISQNGHWAGDGHLDDEGAIVDCPALLGPEGLDATDGSQQDAADRAYEAIEEAIAAGDDHVEIDGCRYTWTIMEHCECAEAAGGPGHRCEGVLGPDAVTVEYMPEYLRASHQAAGNRGTYPANGALRLRVTPECAELLTHEPDEDGEPGEPSEWAHVVA